MDLYAGDPWRGPLWREAELIRKSAAVGTVVTGAWTPPTCS